jgi:hypothetical protein
MSKFDINVNQNFAGAEAEVFLRLRHYHSGECFRITNSTHYHVVAGLKLAIEWFYDNTKKDLFYLNEKDQLVFNNDYNELVVLLNSEQRYNQHIEIRPCVNNNNSERGREGVVIFFNSSGAASTIDREELEQLYTVLNNFSYQTEIELLMKIDMLAVKMKEVRQM